jgi:hypothetical protein
MIKLWLKSACALWVVGYPIYRYDTYERDGNAHGDTGFHITPRIYELFKSVGNPVELPLYITNGWVLDKEATKREILKTRVIGLAGEGHFYIEY